MPSVFPGFATAVWPRPADPAAVAREIATLAAEIAGLDGAADHLAAIAATPPGASALAALFGNSPFLTHCVQRDPAFAGDLLCHGPDAAMTAILGAMDEAGGGDGEGLARALRVARRRAALCHARP